MWEKKEKGETATRKKTQEVRGKRNTNQHVYILGSSPQK